MNSNSPSGVNAAVEAVRLTVEAESAWDVAENNEKLHFNILRAGQSVGRFEPYTENETALIAYLTDRMAGKRLCDFAWRSLAASQDI